MDRMKILGLLAGGAIIFAGVIISNREENGKGERVCAYTEQNHMK